LQFLKYTAISCDVSKVLICTHQTRKPYTELKVELELSKDVAKPTSGQILIYCCQLVSKLPSTNKLHSTSVFLNSLCRHYPLLLEVLVIKSAKVHSTTPSANRQAYWNALFLGSETVCHELFVISPMTPAVGLR